MAPMEILIVGCSIAGPAFASFLLSSPLPNSERPRITVVERSAAPYKRGQNIDIRGVGVTMIRKLGIEAVIRASSTGEEGVQWVTPDNRVWASFGAGGDDKIHMPTSDIEIMRGRLAEILWKRNKDLSDQVKAEGGRGVEYVFGDTLDDLSQDGAKVHVRFAKSQMRRSFDLVVGADGLHSQTRKMAWGAEGEADRVKQLGLYGAFFSIPRADTDTMFRRCFHTAGRLVMMLRPDAQANRTTALLNLVNEKDSRFSDVGSNGREHVEGQKALIREYFQDAGWESERIVREMMRSDDFYYNIAAQVKMQKWSKGRVVLLGDAAYCASHLSGMGTTLALFGAYNLAGALSRHQDDLTAALALYEQNMRPTVDRAQKLMPGIMRIMHLETAWGVWVMDTLIRIIVWSRIVNLLLLFKRPKKDMEIVVEYGLKELLEWKD